MTTEVLVLARTLHIGSAMLLVAFPYFRLFIWGPVVAGAVDESDAVFCRKIIRSMAYALALEAVSGLVWFWFVAAQMNDESPWSWMAPADLQTVLEQTQFGQLWMWRAGLGLALGVILYFWSRGEALPRARPSVQDGIVLALSGGLLVSVAWAGHAAAGIQHHVLHLFADVLHLLIGAIWPMGLIPLTCWLRYNEKRHLGRAADLEIKAVQRFSQISLGAVLLLVMTGFINGWLMIGSWDALFTSVYGRLLLAKVVVIGIMIGLGAINRFYLLPRMEPESASFQTIGKTIMVESFLILVVLLIVGMMGMTSPPS